MVAIVEPIDYERAPLGEIEAHLRALVAEMSVESTEAVLAQFELAYTPAHETLLVEDDPTLHALLRKIAELAEQLRREPAEERLLDAEVYRKLALPLLSRISGLIRARQSRADLSSAGRD